MRLTREQLIAIAARAIGGSVIALPVELYRNVTPWISAAVLVSVPLGVVVAFWLDGRDVDLGMLDGWMLFGGAVSGVSAVIGWTLLDAWSMHAIWAASLPVGAMLAAVLCRLERLEMASVQVRISAERAALLRRETTSTPLGREGCTNEAESLTAGAPPKCGPTPVRLDR